MSAVSRAICGSVANMMWVWASMRPGISVRPAPATRVSDSPSGAGMAPVEIAWIFLPTTITLTGPVIRAAGASNTRTFSNNVAFGPEGVCARAPPPPEANNAAKAPLPASNSRRDI